MWRKFWQKPNIPNIMVTFRSNSIVWHVASVESAAEVDFSDANADSL